MRPKLKPLKEQVMVITGASSGIGLTIARRAASEGATVVLCARNEAALREVRDAIRAGGGQAEFVVGDVGEREDMRRLAETTVERFGRIDTWVNDAGIGVYAKLEEISDEDHQRLFQTNYWGVVYGSTEALKHLKRNGGALINIGSIASEMPTPLLSAYAASKHAVKGFTDSLRMELLQEKAPVSVTLIKPASIDTPFTAHAKSYMDEGAQVPPPVYSPELVADAVLHAAQRPVRMITVGGAGRMMTASAHMAPGLTDRLLTSAFFLLARRGSRRGQPVNLHHAGRDGRRYGDAKLVRRTSLYTAAQTHPRIAAGVGFAVGIAAAAVAAGALSRRGPRGALRRLRQAA
ncbi:MAG TPA: SDR family oxidoreductase [Caulobacteraceae bacterium]|jgi:short-subunit dehydrogenase